MIVVVIFSSFSLGLRAWEKGERNIKFYQQTRAVTDVLCREINSTYPYKIFPGTLDKHTSFFAFFGQSDSLKFVSSANLHKRPGGLSLLEIWVEDDSGLMLGEHAALVSNLSDLEDIELRDEKMSLLISGDVKKIDFKYFDRKTKDDDGEWLDRWDPRDKKNRLPLFVEIILTLTGRNDEEVQQRLVIPIMSVAI